MQLPNKYISVIFILTISYVVYNMVIPSSKKNWGSKPNETGELSTGALELGNVIKGESAMDKDADKKDERRILSWGKDPFIFPEGMNPYKREPNKKVANIPAKRPKKSDKGEQKRLSLKINSILISESQKVATIDRAPYIVTIGDWIENEQVLEIMPDRVIFGKNGRKQEILLKSQSKSFKNSRGKNGY